MTPLVISSLVSGICYLVFLIAIGICEYDNIITLIQRYRLRHRLSINPTEGKLSAMCRNLLMGALGKDIDGIWLIFLVSTVFVITLIVALRSFSIIVSLVMAVFCSSMPVMILFSKMQSRRNKGSKEGISLLTELYRQYKMNNLNMLKAIEMTIVSKGEFSICKKQLFILLIRLQDAANNTEIKRCCKNMAFALGTNWSRSLATCIEIATTKGTDVSLALIDIIEQLKTAKQMTEERKRLNGESMRMTVFLVPLLYVLTIMVSLKYLNISLIKYLYNQFLTPKGLFFFVINLFLFVVNITTMNLIDNTRMDY